MVVIKEEKSANLETAITAAMVADDTTAGIKLVDVGAEGDPKAIWVTSVYAQAGVVGDLHLYQSADGLNKATAGNMIVSMYASLTGDGITQVKYGPITADLYAGSDGTSTFDLNDVTVSYEQV